MKVYAVKAVKLNCEGRFSGHKVLKYFADEKKAEKFKEEWEALWQKHLDEGKCISPCWYDFEKELTIETLEVEE